MPSVVHVGLGAFHRAHQAVYTQDSPGWRIRAIAPRSGTVAGALRAQGHRYHVLVREHGRAEAVPVSAITETLHAPTQRAEAVAALADPDTRVVTLTVTEKAYTPAGDVLGLLVDGLAARRAAEAGPLAVVCCDNLPGNGPTLARLVLAACAARDGGLAGWVESGVAFPATVVDRIVPAATEADHTLVEALTGERDRAAVVAEPYRQWVLQDRFPGGRPAWPGAVFTADVTPYERAKIRVLNGVHSALAYTGALTGHERIDQALADPALGRLAERLALEDVLPTLTPPDGVDLREYTATVLGRMRNPALRHRCAQVAADGSLKVPIRLLGTVRDRLAAGAVPRWAVLAVAAWLRHVTVGLDDAGRPVEAADPGAARLARRAAGNPAANLGRLLGERAVFGDDLPGHRGFTDLLHADLRDLARHGAGTVIRRETTP
ncbi:mannitol dehydrogenase family protein [Nonomuraea sp. NPDC050328]|uniref:mannitol dehydrogenase family protein n=1 Tax=Nonomuraea sp. NPDC050328 TaxID=3364361 RepID=UPI0037999DE8